MSSLLVCKAFVGKYATSQSRKNAVIHLIILKLRPYMFNFYGQKNIVWAIYLQSTTLVFDGAIFGNKDVSLKMERLHIR